MIRKQAASGYGSIHLTMIKSHYAGYFNGFKQQPLVMLTDSVNQGCRQGTDT